MDKNLHFIWIDGGSYEFRMHNFASFLSAVKHLQPKQVYFWTNQVDSYPLLDLAIKIAEEEYGVSTKIEEVLKSYQLSNGRTIHKPSHVADLLKIEKLGKYGGCYSDLDNIFVADQSHYFDMDLYSAPYEHNFYTKEPEAFCANLIFSPRDHVFLKDWLRGYDFYLEDHYYFNAITVPTALLEVYKNTNCAYHLNPVTGDAWSGNHYDRFELYKLYQGDHLSSDFRDVEVFHLWDSHVIDKYLKKHTVDYLLEVDTTYSKIVRPYIKILKEHGYS